MSYDYRTEREKVVTPEASAKVMRFWEKLRPVMQVTGAITGGKALDQVFKFTDFGGDTWTAMAIIERLAEVGLIVCVCQHNCSWQERIYVLADVSKG